MLFNLTANCSEFILSKNKKKTVLHSKYSHIINVQNIKRVRIGSKITFQRHFITHLPSLRTSRSAAKSHVKSAVLPFLVTVMRLIPDQSLR